LYIAIPLPGRAQSHDLRTLVALINAYRAAPDSCNGQQIKPLPPLAAHPALENLHIPSGSFLDQVLERASYPVTRAQAIYIGGSADAGAVLAALKLAYCKTILSEEFSALGASRTGNEWLIVFAQPAPPLAVLHMPNLEQTGTIMLDAINRARASERSCGQTRFPAAPTVAWNALLAKAALAHSQDMATRQYFNHQGKDGAKVAERAVRAGYRWRRIGENIATGQDSAADVVAGWLDSPGHCANVMDPNFTDMGAAYAIDRQRKPPRAYWTQVFGAAR
jgi:uncharacterized protein YkwD